MGYQYRGRGGTGANITPPTGRRHLDLDYSSAIGRERVLDQSRNCNLVRLVQALALGFLVCCLH